MPTLHCSLEDKNMSNALAPLPRTLSPIPGGVLAKRFFPFLGIAGAARVARVCYQWDRDFQAFKIPLDKQLRAMRYLLSPDDPGGAGKKLEEWYFVLDPLTSVAERYSKIFTSITQEFGPFSPDAPLIERFCAKERKLAKPRLALWKALKGGQAHLEEQEITAETDPYKLGRSLLKWIDTRQNSPDGLRSGRLLIPRLHNGFVHRLDLQNLGLHYLPPEIARLKNLDGRYRAALAIRNNHLKRLPKVFLSSKKPCFFYIDARNNPLEEPIPPRFVTHASVQNQEPYFFYTDAHAPLQNQAPGPSTLVRLLRCVFSIFAYVDSMCFSRMLRKVHRRALSILRLF